MYQYQIILLLFFIHYFYHVTSINMNKIRNDMLRVYVYSTPKQLKKGFFRKFHNILYKTSEKINIILIDANSHYYSLSDDDRLLIETIITLSF